MYRSDETDALRNPSGVRHGTSRVRVVDRAEQEALFLILVYSHAVFNLIEMICATAELDLIVLSLNVKPGSCPEWLSQLTARVNSLSLSMAVLDKFQTDYLGAPVLPDHFRVIFEVVRTITGLTLEALGDGSCRDTASFPKTCSDELVRQGIASLKSLIRNWGKLGWVHSVAHKLTLLYLDLETGMMRLVMDHKRCAQLVTMRALGIQPIHNPEDAARQQETRARSRSKSRQRPRTKPTTKSLLASRHRMN
jgi:hypothetical protein